MCNTSVDPESDHPRLRYAWFDNLTMGRRGLTLSLPYSPTPSLVNTSPMLLTTYCILILLASVVGGLVPLLITLTHQRMQIALSFVSGVMLGVALLHLLPHAWVEFEEAGRGGSLNELVLWLVGGFLAIFLLERFFCFHHHEEERHQGAGSGQQAVGSGHDGHGHSHALGWTGAAVGLTVHSALAGAALAASVETESHGGALLAGLGTFLVIFLHKPFDSLTIGALMAAGRHSSGRRHVINGLFALMVPLGAILFMLGLDIASDGAHTVVGGILAFSAGMFLCISLSDLLPELQFHQHDRIKLTAALLAGLALAYAVGLFEGDTHQHGHDEQSSVVDQDHEH